MCYVAVQMAWVRGGESTVTVVSHPDLIPKYHVLVKAEHVPPSPHTDSPYQQVSKQVSQSLNWQYSPVSKHHLYVTHIDLSTQTEPITVKPNITRRSQP